MSHPEHQSQLIEGPLFREAFGVRPACRRFRTTDAHESGSELPALQTLREIRQMDPSRSSGDLHRFQQSLDDCLHGYPFRLRTIVEQDTMALNFTGGATAEQGRDIMSGDNLYGTLNEQKHLQKLAVRGNSYLRSMEEGRSAEVHSANMDFFLDADQRLERAVAMENAGGKTLDADSELQLSGATLIEVLFQAQGDRSRQAILEVAVHLASVEGLEGLTIRRLASETGMSKSGLFAHFGSKEDLQLATVEAARSIFIENVIRPTFEAEKGLPRLKRLCEIWFDYAQNHVFRGGCFFAAASAEFDSRPGRVRDRIWVAAGFSGHGFMLAPAVGRIIAESVIDGLEDTALNVLDAERFADGRLVPEPQVV